ncbi:Amino acid transporter transmembrane [Penicillium concentricum]|uniref:Amino acid transporter transmembrane n=1 Tax=Penicillium concentricum TaxID=293559 RepID=A0A9W9RFU9_9EURO|nr:Amino acid transporter transmembrane [Penicillium concentricum]KAJ5356758.1 Amino acid transporter transmembrane [Penicillium concentricum]
MADKISGADIGADAHLDEGEKMDTKEGTVSVAHEPPAAFIDGNRSMYLDSSITFENYVYWAKRSREVEKHISTDDAGFAYWKKRLFSKRSDVTVQNTSTITEPNDKHTIKTNGDGTGDGWGITETEWEQAQRAGRTATWGSIFYLITTDILGPTNVPWAISQMGYGPGAVLYTVFGGMAGYSGMQLWRIFVGLDSTRFPMRNYGDVAFRVFGNWARILVNVLQSFQFFLNVTLLIVSNGQGLAQMVVGANGQGFLCFIAAEVVFMVIGFVLGQIRTLQRLSYLANIAIWLNVIVIIMTMAVVHQYPPNYEASLTSYETPKGPVKTSGYWPEDSTLKNKVNAMMNAVFAYGGATLFNELMAEMRRPYDFWKGFIIAEIFIYVCYLISGMVVYSAQGQFTFNPAYQGIPNSAYRFQTLGNAISFITGVIAALLYGNIGIKVFYNVVLRDIFHFPDLNSRTGKLLWIGLAPAYWALAWVIAAAIPQISNLTSFVGAACILQFSFTFPPLLLVGFNVQNDAILPEEEFNSATGQTQRLDSGMKRWVRGYKKKFVWNTFDVLYAIGALGAAGLGIWASVTSMHQQFAEGSLTPFTCANPAG